MLPFKLLYQAGTIIPCVPRETIPHYRSGIDGFYAVFREDSNTVQDLLDVTHVEMNAYGIDNDGPMPQLQTRNDVQVPDLSINLSDQELAHLLDTVNPVENDNNFGVTVYENCRQAIGELIERRDA
eukprot:Seg3069.2 transcript_id=Seg3069.2/GoldUCD/mRNA.D3Y31 product="hypothetical protein" protein_id=Seg3069.2/GoldUCD/D3Y31